MERVCVSITKYDQVSPLEYARGMCLVMSVCECVFMGVLLRSLYIIYEIHTKLSIFRSRRSELPDGTHTRAHLHIFTSTYFTHTKAFNLTIIKSPKRLGTLFVVNIHYYEYVLSCSIHEFFIVCFQTVTFLVILKVSLLRKI